MRSLVVISILLFSMASARAEDALQSKFPIDDADPESSIPTNADAMRAPLEMGYWVMLISERGEAAEARNDFSAAVRYYRALAKAVPDRATAYGKMCKAYEALNDRKHALLSCKAALSKPGASLEDSARLVGLIVDSEAPLSAEEIADAKAVVAHLELQLTKGRSDKTVEELKTARIVTSSVACKLAARLDDAAGLSKCVSALGELAPQDPRTFTFGFALALLQRDTDRAAIVLEQARSAKVPEPALAAMQQRLQQAEASASFFAWPPRGDGVWVIALGVLAGLFALFFARRGSRVRAAA